MKITTCHVWTRTAVLALAVVAGFGLGGSALAEQHAKHRAEHFAHVATALGLTDAQRAAAKKLHDEAAAKAGPLEEQGRLQHEEIEAMLESGNPDPAELGRRVIAMHATHKQLKALHEQCMAKVAALLTPQQRAKFEQLHKDHGHSPGGHPMRPHQGKH